MIKSLDSILPGHKLPVDLMVNGINKDSRNVEAGNLFVAVPGVEGDGRNYLEEAVKRKAGAILYEPEWDKLPKKSDVPLFCVEELSSKVGLLASRFYNEPSASLRIIAVTGTNGKTSCGHFVGSALNRLGMKCAIIGTKGMGFSQSMNNPGLTTPDAIELQKAFRSFLDEGAKAVTIEASSHGLEQGRLDGTSVDIAVLTNISRDHLDYHASFEDYKNAKKKLFARKELSGLVLNLDDILGQELLLELSPGLSPALVLMTYSCKDSSADIFAEDATFDESGMSFKLCIPSGSRVIQSRLIGEFNLSNLLALAGVLVLCEFNIDQIADALCATRGVEGRMDVLKKEEFPAVVIDYAHTPDALEKVLMACKRHCKGDLWCVFGCGGDRDKGKRPQMGSIASVLADQIVITDDNPRTESSNDIVNDILGGVKKEKEVNIETNRRRAIEFAVGEARKEDWVLVAGKGHELYQEIRGERVPYSDYEVVSQIFGMKES